LVKDTDVYEKAAELKNYVERYDYESALFIIHEIINKLFGESFEKPGE
jgi:hypothetical protein